MRVEIGPHPSDRAIFLSALDIANQRERRAFLYKACGDDPERRHKIERLLAADGVEPLPQVDTELVRLNRHMRVD